MFSLFFMDHRIHSRTYRAAFLSIPCKFAPQNQYYMKIRSLLFIVVFFCTPLISFAQFGVSTFYLRASGGYSFPFSGATEMQGLGIEGSEYSNATMAAYSRKNVSYGQGANARVAVGFSASRNFAFEVSLHRVFSPTFLYTDQYENVPTKTEYAYSTQASNLYYAIPSVTVHSDGPFMVYARAGLALPLKSVISREITGTSTVAGATSKMSLAQDLSLKFTPGFEGACGVMLPLSWSVRLFGEMNVISHNPQARQLETTSYKVGGADVVDNMSTNEKVTVYSRDLEYSFSTSKDEPKQATTFSVPFSSMGINVGIVYGF